MKMKWTYAIAAVIGLAVSVVTIQKAQCSGQGTCGSYSGFWIFGGCSGGKTCTASTYFRPGTAPGGGPGGSYIADGSCLQSAGTSDCSCVPYGKWRLARPDAPSQPAVQ